MSVLVIDNYDSFVHNLARYFRLLGAETQVIRNDKLSVDQIAAMQPSHIVLSPGPCTPSSAGICIDVVRRFAKTIPILGVCLGHQVIAEAFGGKVIRASVPVHGKASWVIPSAPTGVFAEVSERIKVGRYHSLIVDEPSLPRELIVNARTLDGTIMSIAHQQWPVWGLQFHPESVLTEQGELMLANFLAIRSSVFSV